MSQLNSDYLLFAAAGLSLGLSHLYPAWGLFAWLGVALTAIALTRELSPRQALLGLWGQAMIATLVGHPWHLNTTDTYIPGGVEVALLVAIPGTLLFTLTWAGPLWLVWRLCHRFSALWWLPTGWLMAEAAQGVLTGLTHSHWLYSQWQIFPVLRLVGRLGWVPATLVCLSLATLMGLAVTRRKPLRGALAIAGTAGLWLFPPAPKADLALLRDVGAVHLQSFAQLPRQIPPGVRLMVWPEAMSTQRPRLREGLGQGKRIWLPTIGGSADHLYGVITRIAEGLQVALVTVDPQGRLIGSRAKRRLMILTETPWFGILLPRGIPFVTGSAPPILEVAGRKVVGLLCYEAFDRSLSLEGRAHGGQLITISARDTLLKGHPVGMQQFMAISVLRAAETGLPVVRSALYGQAAFVDADGTVLAASEPGTDGILTLSVP